MKKLLLFVLVLALCFALPVFAQDDNKMESDAGMAMMPPPAIDNAFLKSYVGNWAGKIEGTMGTSEDKLSCQMGLGGQFLMMQVDSKSDMGSYAGMGAMTLGQDGKVKGYWIDNMRSMAEGTGMIEGNKLTITWKTDMWTYTRTEEKIDDNTLAITGKMVMGDGTVSEEKGTYKRTEAMTDKM